MTAKEKNRNLHKAKSSKKDEFYTQLSDIEKELKHYTNSTSRARWCRSRDFKAHGI